jgi:hypothetical protein
MSAAEYAETEAVARQQTVGVAWRIRSLTPAREQPKAAKSSQEQPRAAKSSQEQPRAAKSSQEQPRAAESSQRQPRAAKSSREQPRAANGDTGYGDVRDAQTDDIAETYADACANRVVLSFRLGGNDCNSSNEP